MQILGLIDKLEALATSAKKVPLGHKAIVDAEKLLELVDQMRVAIPEDVAESQEVLRKREELLNQSLGEARRIRSSAESEYRSRVEENQLVKEAHKRATQVVEEAQQKTQRILLQAEKDAAGRRASADEYTQEVLYQLEQEVSHLLTAIRNGIEMLEKTPEAALR
ncbi:MAG: hypothetical protein HY535_05155 [Chloroflexi bacterium]|nr:hypothetical protein [Chloroflexota bacterium]